MSCAKAKHSQKINILDSHEIIEAKWISLDEDLNCEDIHIYNKNIVQTAIKDKGLKLGSHNYFGDSGNQHEYYF